MSNLPETIASLPSRGQCWGWDWTLLAIRGISDLFTFLSFAVICMVAYYIYRTGRLRGLKYFYPSLWRLGAVFIGLRGISDLGDAIELVVGGNVFWITTTINILVAVIATLFAITFFKVRDDIALVARVLSNVHEQSGEHTIAKAIQDSTTTREEGVS